MTATHSDAAERQQAPRSTEMTVACVFNDKSVLLAYLCPSLGESGHKAPHLFLDNTGNVCGKNIARLYNTLMAIDGPDLVAFLHPDVGFKPEFLGGLGDTIAALAEKGVKWGALGIVGRGFEGEYIWCHEVAAPEPVCCLDCCALITRRSLGIRFDSRLFNEFHCYVEDYCLQCHAAGLDVLVVPGEAWHGSATKGVRGGQWGKYRWYRRLLGFKWRKLMPRLYTC